MLPDGKIKVILRDDVCNYTNVLCRKLFEQPFIMRIEALNDDLEVTEIWKLTNCELITCSYNDLDYATSLPSKIIVEIFYKQLNYTLNETEFLKNQWTHEPA